MTSPTTPVVSPPMRLAVPTIPCTVVFILAAFLCPAAEGPPSITTQPASQTVLQGSSVNFSVVADGTAPLTYQWRRGGTSIQDATNTTYSIAAATVGDDNIQFSVVVSNALSTAT